MEKPGNGAGRRDGAWHHDGDGPIDLVRWGENVRKSVSSLLPTPPNWRKVPIQST